MPKGPLIVISLVSWYSVRFPIDSSVYFNPYFLLGFSFFCLDSISFRDLGGCLGGFPMELAGVPVL